MKRILDNVIYYIIPMILLIGLIFLSFLFPLEKESGHRPINDQPVTQEPRPSNPESRPTNPDSQPDDKEQPANSEPKPDAPRIIWGVDSASITTENLLACVRENVGQPKVWGRYLGDKDDVSSGLKKEEVQLLHFQKAIETNPALKSDTVIWSAYPQVGITTEQEAPAFQGVAPKGSLLLGWQYGLEAQSCNIDTNLFKEDIMAYLWNKE